MTESSIAPMISGILRLILAFIVPLYIQKVNPKTAFVSGQIVKAFAMTAIATYFYVYEKSPEFCQYFTWLPMVMFILEFCIRSALIIPVLFTLVGESYPTGRAF